MGVERQHATAESGQDPGQDGANGSGSDDPSGLAVQVEAEQPVEGEVALAHAVEGTVGLAVQRQNQGEGMLGHRMGGIGWHTRN